MVLVDIDVLERDPQWWQWFVGQMRTWSRTHQLAINAVIYAELAATHTSSAVLDQKIATMKLVFEAIPRPAAFLAGKAFVLYRRGGRTETRRIGRLLHWSARGGGRVSASDARSAQIRSVLSRRDVDPALTAIRPRSFPLLNLLT